jgi:putative CocE/NonD family hydrolase
MEPGGSSFDTFRHMRHKATTDTARRHQHLLFTPAHHSMYHACTEHDESGARTLGDTRFPYYRTLIDWFGRWLRDDPVDLAPWPQVRYFLLNRNAWCTADDWPPRDVEWQRWYLTSGGRANSRSGDGALSTNTPDGEQPPDRFVYDPADPVPSEPSGTTLDLLGGGFADRATIEDRSDVVVYTSPTLAHPLAIVGPVSLEIYVSSSAVDTDFAAVLTEVDAAGRSINITHGIARTRYREGLDRCVFMEPGHVYRVAIDLWHAAVEIPAGHRLRLTISSSHFPFYDRNLNTGGDNYVDTHWSVAENSVHHDPHHCSALLLPVRTSS